jgi:hypothetical protein
MKREWDGVERSREGKTYHDNHNSLNTPPNPSSIIMIRKPMESSSDRWIFLGLILSFTIISSSSGRMKDGAKRRREGGRERTS